MANEVFRAIEKQGGKAYYVGGTVRDKLLGIPNNDFDVEVFGISLAQLRNVLSKFGDVNEVGSSFGILKVSTMPDYDFSLPRLESRTGALHTDFEVTLVPDMSMKQAAERRDFTINSMALDAINGTLLDYYGGQQDLSDRVLRPTSDKFMEDPLRVLRGMQFCGRFGLKSSDAAIEYSLELLPEHDSITAERIWAEWCKWAAKSVKPSLGLRFLLETGWIETVPFLLDLIGVKQTPEHHPEGDVWRHTLHAVDAMAGICDRIGATGEERATLVFAALLHDIGKPETTEALDGRITTYGHDQVGADKAPAFFEAIAGDYGQAARIAEQVIPLIREHMYLALADPKDASVRRLANRLKPASIDQLVLLIEADHAARPPIPPTNPGVGLLAVAEKLRIKDSAPVPIVMGRHLIEAGLEPGPHFANILYTLFEMQLDGEISSVEDAQPHIQELRKQ